jgi:hypothetical protein
VWRPFRALTKCGVAWRRLVIPARRHKIPRIKLAGSMASGSWPLTKTCDAIALEEIVQVHDVKLEKTNKKLTAGWTWCQCVRLVVLDRKSISTAAKKKKTGGDDGDCRHRELCSRNIDVPGIINRECGHKTTQRRSISNPKSSSGASMSSVSAGHRKSSPPAGCSLSISLMIVKSFHLFSTGECRFRPRIDLQNSALNSFTARGKQTEDQEEEVAQQEAGRCRLVPTFPVHPQAAKLARIWGSGVWPAAGWKV